MQHDEIAEFIIQQIKDGAGKWEMPWHRGLPEAVNGVTGKTFRGQNATILWAASTQRGYRSVEWATLRQWNSVGGRVRRGAKSVKVVRPRLHRQADVFGDESEQAHGFKLYNVFNYEEVNGVDHEHPDLFALDAPPPPNNNAEAEQVVAASGADIRYEGDAACFVPRQDCIYMPPRRSFKATAQATASENFYATLLHELIHWTKPSHRCDRKLAFDDSDQSYAFEELVAELGAAVLNTRFHKLPAPRPDHAAYLNGWLRVLEHDFRYFYRAMRLAQDAGDWLCKRAGLDQHVSLPDTAPQPEPDETSPRPHEEAGARPASDSVATKRLRVTCGACREIFLVTLSRHEDGVRCPDCHRYNRLKVAW